MINNKKIETILVPVTTNITKYKTTDGQLFLELELANIHQGKFDGTIKDCPDCKGVGYHYKMKTIPKRNYPTKAPDYGWVTEEIEVKIDCVKCSGKGYLTLSWS